jgi:hypothetical protein
VNEDPNAKMIRELREELDRLRAEVGFFALVEFLALDGQFV